MKDSRAGIQKVMQRALKRVVSYFAFLPLLLITGIFISCAENRMTVEDAKKVSMSMAQNSYTPPPRRVDDILAVLRDTTKVDPDFGGLKEALAAVVPENIDTQARMSALYKRGKAAENLGLSGEALRDLREAYRLMQTTGSWDWDLERYAGLVETRFGDMNQGIAIFEAHVKRPKPNGLAYWQLLKCYARIGDFQAVERIRSIGQEALRHDKSVMASQHRPMIEYTYLRAQGKYQEAEPQVRQALDVARQIAGRGHYPTLAITHRSYLIQNLLDQGRWQESEIEARQSIREALAVVGKTSMLTVYGLDDLAHARMGQGRVGDARKILEAALVLSQEIGVSEDSLALASQRVLLGNAVAGQEDFTGAMDQFVRAQKGLKSNAGIYRLIFERDPHVIFTYLMGKRTDEALRMSQDAYSVYRSNLGETHYRTAEMLALRGIAYAGQNQLEPAFEDLRVSVPALLSHASNKSDFLAKQRLNYILEAYISILQKIQQTPLAGKYGGDPTEEAFKLADARIATRVKSALGAVGARAAAAYDTELADLVRKEQDTQEQVAALENSLCESLALSPDQQNETTLSELRSSIRSLETARQVLLSEIKRRFPKYADFIDPQPAGFDTVQRNLRPAEALLFFYPARHETWVWAIPQNGKPLFAAASIGREELHAAVTSLRKTLAPDPKTLGEVPAFDLNLSHDLYAKLFKPVENACQGATDLVVIASGPLGQIPLDVLTTAPAHLTEKVELFAGYREIPWLIRRATITRIPSVASLVMLRTMPPGDPSRRPFAGFGDPYFNPEHMKAANVEKQKGPAGLAIRGGGFAIRGVRVSSLGNLDSAQTVSAQIGSLNRLPDTAEEIQSLAETLAANSAENVFLGERASERKVKSMNLADRRIIAFASHGLMAGDLDGLDQPAIALTAPSVTGDDEDGLLTMTEILKLKLNADWVILSACNTGAAQGDGAEAVSGLGRAFFYAGSKSLLVTMWPVETTSIRKLTTGVFRYQKEDPALSRAQALRKSVLDLLDHQVIRDEATGKIVAAYAHPLFWAPFILVGEGRQ